jgi:hypothetical protein
METTMKKKLARVLPVCAAASMLFACAGALAQATTPTPPATAGNAAPTTRSDRGTAITTQVQRNVPAAQRSDQASRFRPANPLDANDPPDVLLDIPNLSVDEITLDVQNLQAHVSLDARVASLVKITAGVDASIDKVNLSIKGVKASVLLIVRLDNVREIVTKTLDTLDKNPQLVERLLDTVDNTVDTVGGVANTALQPGGVISQTVNTLGQTVSRTVDAAGNIVERTVDQAGRVVSTAPVGRLLDLPLVRETTNSAGQTVRQVRDTSGAVLELTLDRAGAVTGSRIVSAAPGQRGSSAGGSRPAAATPAAPAR